MSDVKNIWVLKQPIEVDTAVTTTGKWFGFDGKVLTCMNEEMFAELFQPLDVESLTRQLEDILQNFWRDEAQDLDDSVAEVLELIGITKEQK